MSFYIAGYANQKAGLTASGKGEIALQCIRTEEALTQPAVEASIPPVPYDVRPNLPPGLLPHLLVTSCPSAGEQTC